MKMAGFLGLQWVEFCRALGNGELIRPFLVRETAEDKANWFLYAQRGDLIVLVLTLRHERRSWRTLDGAVADLSRQLPDFPPLTIYSSEEAVDLGSTPMK
jgi:hypothetical protein